MWTACWPPTGSWTGDLILQLLQTLCCLPQHVAGLAEREAHFLPSHLRPAVETRAWHRSHAMLGRELLRELDVRQGREGGEIGEHVVRPFGRRALEPRLHQRAAEQVATSPVLPGERLVVVASQRFDRDGNALLQ